VAKKITTMANPITNSFIDGIAYFFGIGDNPIEKYYHDAVRKRQERNKGLSGWEIDARNLAGDWQRIGMDTQKAYNNEPAKKGPDKKQCQK
jgi:hypothetical protein